MSDLPTRSDAVVVGGGVVGLSVAYELARRGRQVLVLDRGEHAGIATHIVLNKTDLPQADAARERLKPYRDMGVPVLELALKARRDEAREHLAPLLRDATTLALGPSGTGKSTLINLMVEHADAQVGEISKALNSGRHTTTTTTWRGAPTSLERG